MKQFATSLLLICLIQGDVLGQPIPPTRPNILIILPDQLRAAAMDCMGDAAKQ